MLLLIIIPYFELSAIVEVVEFAASAMPEGDWDHRQLLLGLLAIVAVAFTEPTIDLHHI